MQQLYYGILVRGEENIFFRKPSPFPFPSPLGTIHTVPVGVGGELRVAYYSHEKDADGNDILYMIFGELGDKEEHLYSYPSVHGYGTPEEDAALKAAGWEEIDVFGKVVSW